MNHANKTRPAGRRVANIGKHPWTLMPCLLLAWAAGGLFAVPAAAVETLQLQNAQLRLDVTAQLGGRVLWFSSPGMANVLKVGDAVVAQPDPVASASADNIGYLGHEVWLGPQSQWWTQQSLNPQRRAEQANWPPDPWLGFARNRVLRHDRQQLDMQGVDSPVSGVRVDKRFRLSAEHPHTLELTATATNIRDTPVAWDLWFNSRSHAYSRVYVPVATTGDVDDSTDFSGPGVLPLHWQLHDGLLSLQQPALPADATAWRGKLKIQPSAGWMAGFVQGQLFLIRFQHLAHALIHPQQGQVELYLDSQRDPAEGLLEMEVHGAYQTLAAGESMRLQEWWTVLPYPGPATAPAERAFLCANAARLAIKPPCGAAPADPAAGEG